MGRNHQAGFTLWELLITLLVAGVVFGLGIPNFREFQRNSVMTSAANDLITGLLAARAEAVKRQVPVTLCASPDPLAAPPVCSPDGAGTNGGFIVWVDWDSTHVDGNQNPQFTASDGNAVVDPGETAGVPVIIRSATPPTAAPAGTVRVYAATGGGVSSAYVTFGPNGFVRSANGMGFPSMQWVLYCDDRGNKLTTGGTSAARVVRIDPTGRANVQSGTDDVTSAVAQTGGACP
ncbi:MAG TPA: GspH/FimT family pseudopilin [Gammaproteobacteria bacterium]|jgi:type IV fimbrial biogenesis protein FimT|nr:GspH/FimT family pseudopilin [Gammaproteobacteria bacterium]